VSEKDLRDAAKVLRERAENATPSPWINFGHGIGVEVKGCTCAGPIPGYPQHESWCGTDGPIVDGTEPDISYIATVHPSVGLALADVLDEAAQWGHFDGDDKVHALARAVLGKS
jgi:hypothetical protein